MTSQVDSTQVKLAVEALYKHLEKVKETSNDLLSDDEPLWCVFGVKKVPEKSRVKPIRIPVKNSFINSETRVCFFVRDGLKDYQKFSIPPIQEVMNLSKLRSNYKSFEQKRLLCASFDLFLCDANILPRLPKLLGKTFFAKKKQPVAINITQFKQELKRVKFSTLLHMTTGTCTSVKVGNSGQSVKEVVENIMVVIPAVVEQIPKKWKNVQSICFKSSESVSLPIWNNLPKEATAI